MGRANRIELDADHVAGFEELLPGIGPAPGMGQLEHAALHHLANGLGLILVTHNAAVMMHSDDTARIRTGDAELRGRQCGGG